MNKEIWDALTAIVDGYEGRVEYGFIWVKNPNFKEDDGSMPVLVIEANFLRSLLDPR